MKIIKRNYCIWSFKSHSSLQISNLHFSTVTRVVQLCFLQLWKNSQNSGLSSLVLIFRNSFMLLYHHFLITVKRWRGQVLSQFHVQWVQETWSCSQKRKCSSCTEKIYIKTFIWSDMNHFIREETWFYSQDLSAAWVCEAAEPQPSFKSQN